MKGVHAESCRVGYNKFLADSFIFKMKESMKANRKNPSKIIAEGVTDVDMEIMGQMPQPNSLRRTIQRVWGSNQRTNDIINYEIPEALKKFVHSDIKFNVWNPKSKKTEAKRIIAFADLELLGSLVFIPDEIFGDGTFDKTPIGFYQLYTFHGQIDNRYVKVFVYQY